MRNQRGFPLLVLLCADLACRSAESSLQAQQGQFPNLPEDWSVFVTGMPPGFLYVPQEDGTDGNLQKGISVLPDFANKPKGMRRFDLRGFLKESGVEFPERGSAVYY